MLRWVEDKPREYTRYMAKISMEYREKKVQECEHKPCHTDLRITKVNMGTVENNCEVTQVNCSNKSREGHLVEQMVELIPGMGEQLVVLAERNSAGQSITSDKSTIDIAC